MQTAPSTMWKFLNRRSRNGQSIIIVAIAFITLIAFVGIAVDVALLFVRYSSLRRAVDAAAIAAAQQIREDTDYATLAAVAQQFIKLQGNIDPETVRVETCETEMHDLIESDPVSYPNAQAALNAILQKIPPSELCKRDPQKLVRVSAQVRSPTTFLSLIGWPSVLLEASAVSQTAVLDVALVIDTSLSMGYDTEFAQANYTGSPTNVEALKSFVEFMNPLNLQPYSDSGTPNYSGKNGAGQAAIRYECWSAPNIRAWQVVGGANGRNANYAWGACCNDPSTQSNPDGSEPNRTNAGTNYAYVDAEGKIPAFDVNTPPMFQTPPVKYAPDFYVFDDPGQPESTIAKDGASGRARVVSGEPDGNYSDLLCRPFKDVRDAARRFIKKLDFVRGDRLVMVTFNAQVAQITPQGQSIPVITDKDTAIRTLNERVGISINPSGAQTGCYAWDTWRGTDPANPTLYGVNLRNTRSYWNVSQCTDTNMGGGVRTGRASITDPDWIRRDSVWVMVLLSDGFPNRTPNFQELDSEFGITGIARPSLTVMPEDQAIPSGKTIDDFCNFDNYLADPVNSVYGTKPHLCVPPLWTGEPWGLTSGGASPSPVWSFGFCPWYTFCNQDPSRSPVLPECTASDTAPKWYDIDDKFGRGRPGGGDYQEPVQPYCIDWNPDSRHFCKDVDGIINPMGAYCDDRYDPDDYLRDQADFAGLLEYTPKIKGSFIAMFTILFNPSGGFINLNILGVKALRYIADAGDNGTINNRLQAWYRFQHNKLINPKDPGYNPTSPLPGLPQTEGYYPPNTDPIYDASGVKVSEDPCEDLDYSNYVNQTSNYYTPGSAEYEAMAKTDCGQYWYAENVAKVNDAFTEIARRLFTRLSR